MLDQASKPGPVSCQNTGVSAPFLEHPYRCARSIRLTNLELRLLYNLLSRAGRPFTAEELCTRIWGSDSNVDLSTLKKLVYRLRQKIELDSANPAYIRTVPGMGYQFSVKLHYTPV